MPHLMDVPALVLIALVTAVSLWPLVDCVRTPAHRVRFVPKPLWLLFLLSGSFLAALAWVCCGKKPIPDTTTIPLRRAGSLARTG
ncbi:hypothetical protein ACFYXJ_26590 [Streptomyces sp. NPDC002667]|uniref:hypothetical protein n=1 Tax=Streptomyces sp. NPDC002667 TaxID=3364657 RepID=UPI0036BEFF89